AQETREAAGLAGRVAAVALALLPATVCLGATLPVLGHALAASSVGKRGGLLYALNPLGGAVGIAAMGFGLPTLIGVRASYLTVASASALTGVVALAVGDAGAAAPRLAASARPSLAPARLRLVAAGSGALGLGLEVLWTRLFAQVLHNSVYSFAAVGLVFLLALAAGAALSALLLRRTAPAVVAGGALLGAAAATVGGIWLFVRAPAGARLRPLGYAALLALVALDPVRTPLTHLASGETLRALAEGPAGIVTVVDTGDDLQLRLDNYYVLGGSAAATGERRQGLL